MTMGQTTHKLLICIGILLNLCFADFDSLHNSLQQLTLKPDSSKVTSNEIIADSAQFLFPPARTVLNGNICNIELKPKIIVDSVLIFAKYSMNQIDTIGTLHTPPFTLKWDYSKIPDQDQMHLQLGYILYLPSGIKIISRPLPHRLVINRKKTISRRKKFHGYQTTTPEKFKIDGNLHEWNKIPKKAIGRAGYAKLVWTIGKLYFAAHVEDNSITTGDFLELHFDMYNNKSDFAGINHRTIRFGPRTRGLFFTVELTDSGFMPADSVTMLIKEHMEWSTNITNNNYTVEAAIPFFCLSDLNYPSMKSGFDITLMDIDDTDTSFFSWAGNSTIYSRFSPARWGTLVLHQAMFPLSLTLLIGAIFFSLIIIILIIWLFVHYIKEQRFENDEMKNYSDNMQKIILLINKNISKTDLSISFISSQTGISPQTITTFIQNEAHCTFDYFILKERIKFSKTLLNTKEYDPLKIINATGFRGLGDFESAFKSITGTTPEAFHKRKVLEMEEE